MSDNTPPIDEEVLALQEEDDFLRLMREMNGTKSERSVSVTSDEVSTPSGGDKPEPDPSLSPTRKKTHDRTVSWGQNSIETAMSTRAGFDVEPLPRGDALNPISKAKSVSSLPVRNKEVNVPSQPGDDAEQIINSMNPFEEEAERALLKAMEHRQRSQRGLQKASSLLSSIPDDCNHNFEDTTAPETPSNASQHDMDDDEDDYDGGDGPNEASKRSSAPSRTSEERPLVNRRIPSQAGNSVEQTLFDLTTAMYAMHGRSTRHFRPSAMSSIPGGSAEEMAENAVMLDEKDGQKKKASRWKTVKRNLSKVGDMEEDQLGPNDIDETSTASYDVESGSPPANSKHHKSKKHHGHIESVQDIFKRDWEIWTDFFRPRRGRLWTRLKVVSLYLLLPLVAVAAILFYFVDNPPTGQGATGSASASWIILFCCRQVITFVMAMCMQAFVVDFLATGSRVMLKLTGPVITLLIAQSKGWPHILLWWCTFDFALLFGTHRFAKHWLFYQSVFRVFNGDNSSGDITSNEWYQRALIIGVSVSIVAAIKRFVVGLYLGRQTFAHYGQSLAQIMEKMLHISEVAHLAIEIEDYSQKGRCRAWTEDSRLRGMLFTDDDNEEEGTAWRSSKSVADGEQMVIDPEKRDALTGSLKFSEKQKLLQLLDAWEEPSRDDNLAMNEIASISAVLRFRRALTFMHSQYPFSIEFGSADDRETCIESAQKMYQRLLKGTPDLDVLHFETIARLAIDNKGGIDQVKAKALIKLFRPGRDGELTILDFVKSIDAVYKEFRMLSATIENSSQIDHAFERIFNAVFYFVVIVIILSQLGFDPLSLLLSLSSVILAFAFAIGNSASSYLEGVLFILGRRPYGIGDFISIAEPGAPQSVDGAAPYNVVNVTLFETILVYLPTNERTSLSNGSLASKMVTNWARSPQAQFHIFLKFPLNAPYEKIVLFKRAVEEYMKARPREWRALNGFRANRMMTERNYLELIIVIQHRDAWQQVGQVLDSKANLSSYCQAVMRQLGLHYEAPRLPVDLTYAKAAPTEASSNDSNADMDNETMVKVFQSLARTKHNITTS